MTTGRLYVSLMICAIVLAYAGGIPLVMIGFPLGWVIPWLVIVMSLVSAVGWFAAKSPFEDDRQEED